MLHPKVTRKNLKKNLLRGSEELKNKPEETVINGAKNEELEKSNQKNQPQSSFEGAINNTADDALKTKLPPPPPAATRVKTIGEYRVGVDFNPSKFPEVDKIKGKAAEVIDAILNEADANTESIGGDALEGKMVGFALLVDTFNGNTPAGSHPEIDRLFKIVAGRVEKASGFAYHIGASASHKENAEIAADLIEEAAMWAVKAYTKSLPVVAEEKL